MTLFAVTEALSLGAPSSEVCAAGVAAAVQRIARLLRRLTLLTLVSGSKATSLPVLDEAEESGTVAALVILAEAIAKEEGRGGRGALVSVGAAAPL